MFATFNVSVMSVAIQRKIPEVKLTLKRDWERARRQKERRGAGCQSALCSLTLVFAVTTQMFRITPERHHRLTYLNGVVGKTEEFIRTPTPHTFSWSVPACEIVMVKSSGGVKHNRARGARAMAIWANVVWTGPRSNFSATSTEGLGGVG